ncbi:MAG: hypothetical protein Q8S11_06335 [Daejeonella sp.]|uniref:hypothetical protein n=1 Tax=Daejeonella sp. TaxID=2805397 RepID=UPI0027332A11|nr:hypothetical protein [Daejeonella sp.]MDP3467933.1 hypothetical protein [Daejeonella sp.]
MKVLLSFILLLFIAAEIKAQVASSTLYITLSDIQSVKITELPAESKSALTEKKSGQGDISILNPSSSQIRKFESQTGNTQILSQDNSQSSGIEIPASVFSGPGANMQMAKLSNQKLSAVPLVVYQIDPR